MNQQILTRLFLVALALALPTCIANGDIVIDIGNADDQITPIVVNAGDTASVPFLATTTLTTTLSGYNLAVEFGANTSGTGGNGFGLGGNFERSDFSVSEIPGGFSGTLALTGDAVGGPAFYAANGIPTNYDFQVNHNGVVRSFGAGVQFGMFNLVIDVPANATPGIYDVRIEASDTPGGDNSIAGGGVPFTVNQGSIRVVAAVPEPTGTIMIAACLTGFISRRRRSAA